MKKLLLLLGITVLTSSFAQAGAILVSPDPFTPTPTTGGNDRYELVLDPTGMEGTFDTFEVIVTANTPLNQTSNDLIQVPGEDSGFSAFLTAPAAFGGQGLSPFGVDASTDLTSGISGTFASLGTNDASLQGSYSVAFLVTAPGGSGTFRYAFFDDGDTVGEGQGLYGIPEPGTLALAGLGLLGIAIRRRG